MATIIVAGDWDDFDGSMFHNVVQIKSHEHLLDINNEWNKPVFYKTSLAFTTVTDMLYDMLDVHETKSLRFYTDLSLETYNKTTSIMIAIEAYADQGTKQVWREQVIDSYYMFRKFLNEGFDFYTTTLPYHEASENLTNFIENDAHLSDNINEFDIDDVEYQQYFTSMLEKAAKFFGE